MQKLSLLAIFLLISCASIAAPDYENQNKIVNEEFKPNDFFLKCQTYNKYSKNNRGVDGYWQYDSKNEVLKGIGYNYSSIYKRGPIKSYLAYKFKLKSFSKVSLEFVEPLNLKFEEDFDRTIYFDREYLTITHYLTPHVQMPCELITKEGIEKAEIEFQKKLIEYEENRPDQQI